MVTNSFRPQGYNAACPYLIVSDAAGTIAFLEQTFVATALRRHPDEAGRLRHAEVRIDDSVVLLADSLRSGRRCPAMYTFMYSTWMPPTPGRWRPVASRCKSPCAKMTRTSAAA
jgi:hypothetical protein